MLKTEVKHFCVIAVVADSRKMAGPHQSMAWNKTFIAKDATEEKNTKKANLASHPGPNVVQFYCVQSEDPRPSV